MDAGFRRWQAEQMNNHPSRFTNSQVNVSPQWQTELDDGDDGDDEGGKVQFTKL